MRFQTIVCVSRHLYAFPDTLWAKAHGPRLMGRAHGPGPGPGPTLPIIKQNQHTQFHSIIGNVLGSEPSGLSHIYGGLDTFSRKMTSQKARTCFCLRFPQETPGPGARARAWPMDGPWPIKCSKPSIKCLETHRKCLKTYVKCLETTTSVWEHP